MTELKEDALLTVWDVALLPTFTIFFVRPLMPEQGRSVRCLCILINHFLTSRHRYWGKNSHGATSSNTAYYQQPTPFYCRVPKDDAIDALPVTFVDTFFGTRGMPVLNLANIVTISLGGAVGGVSFTSGANLCTKYVDLGIEGGGSTGYVASVTEICSLASGVSNLKPRECTRLQQFQGAPQCPLPDVNLGSVTDQVGFDAIYVQFCKAGSAPQSSRLHSCPMIMHVACKTISSYRACQENIILHGNLPHGTYGHGRLAQTQTTAAGLGYITIENLSNIAVQMKKGFPSFGQAYTADVETVSFGGYIWEAAYWTNAVPGSNSSGWSAVGAAEEVVVGADRVDGLTRARTTTATRVVLFLQRLKLRGPAARHDINWTRSPFPHDQLRVVGTSGPQAGARIPLECKVRVKWDILSKEGPGALPSSHKYNFTN
ncbi:hypothetical protein HD554DRAFT_2035812 [Boletus coccyginus]|nr:hypothetical protein HD554DRAFT_2035812 [Boletus coccyginus]